jgi:hypothetical protein
VHLLLRLEDPNNTGVVDFSDSEALRATLKTGSMVSKLGIMFRAYDADRNGYLDREELVSAITEQVKYNRLEVTEDRILAVVEAVFETAGEQHHLSCAEFVSLLRTDPQICSMFDLLSVNALPCGNSAICQRAGGKLRHYTSGRNNTISCPRCRQNGIQRCARRNNLVGCSCSPVPTSLS